MCENDWEVDHRRDEARRIAAPSLTTCNRTAPVVTDRSVISASHEAATDGKHVLKCVSTVSADLQHAAVKSYIGIYVRCFKVEVLPEGYLR
jgi:hypothetical protein